MYHMQNVEMHKRFHLRQLQVAQSTNDFLHVSLCCCLISAFPNEPMCQDVILWSPWIWCFVIFNINNLQHVVHECLFCCHQLITIPTVAAVHESFWIFHMHFMFIGARRVCSYSQIPLKHSALAVHSSCRMFFAAIDWAGSCGWNINTGISSKSMCIKMQMYSNSQIK